MFPSLLIVVSPSPRTIFAAAKRRCFSFSLLNTPYFCRGPIAVFILIGCRYCRCESPARLLVNNPPLFSFKKKKTYRRRESAEIILFFTNRHFADPMHWRALLLFDSNLFIFPTILFLITTPRCRREATVPPFCFSIADAKHRHSFLLLIHF